ncbi:hypothetical protein CDD80_2497 [Ophiocordyceps camponoti-rufipedis]|uniref:Uncharacterized protein n=1 Tax=Ophiocordyceps camponoti-rufipedis TaxID=2004952 RepID=A0A2C5Z659_9HYPO|nr:hypothetical protein CDD80_2497 [Ophiocordyceps camponoti-rufipedis]
MDNGTTLEVQHPSQPISWSGTNSEASQTSIATPQSPDQVRNEELLELEYMEQQEEAIYESQRRLDFMDVRVDGHDARFQDLEHDTYEQFVLLENMDYDLKSCNATINDQAVIIQELEWKIEDQEASSARLRAYFEEQTAKADSQREELKAMIKEQGETFEKRQQMLETEMKYLQVRVSQQKLMLEAQEKDYEEQEARYRERFDSIEADCRKKDREYTERFKGFRMDDFTYLRKTVQDEATRLENYQKHMMHYESSTNQLHLRVSTSEQQFDRLLAAKVEESKKMLNEEMDRVMRQKIVKMESDTASQLAEINRILTGWDNAFATVLEGRRNLSTLQANAGTHLQNGEE